MISSGQTELFDSDLMGELNRLKIELLNSGRSLVDLSMINPDLPPNRFLLDKLSEACIKASNHRYSVSRGIKKLRQAFSEKFDVRFGVSLDPESEICVTMGTKDAIFNVLLCVASPGDNILLGKPTYPAHLSACKLSGLNPVYFEIDPSPEVMLKNFEENIKQTKPRAAILNFPNNPTGITVDEEFFGKVKKIAGENGVILINDFVYGEMGFGTSAQPSLLANRSATELCLEVYSLSKAYGVPGWRVGALMGNSEIVGRLSKIKSHIDYGIFLPIQIASAAALTAERDLISDVVAEYKRRARALTRGLEALGWKVQQPSAGASVWAAPFEKGAAFSSVEMARKLLLNQDVLVTPGALFGSEYDNYLRFALVVGGEQIHQVVNRLGSFREAA